MLKASVGERGTHRQRTIAIACFVVGASEVVGGAKLCAAPRTWERCCSSGRGDAKGGKVVREALEAFQREYAMTRPSVRVLWLCVRE